MVQKYLFFSAILLPRVLIKRFLFILSVDLQKGDKKRRATITRDAPLKAL